MSSRMPSRGRSASWKDDGGAFGSMRRTSRLLPTHVSQGTVQIDVKDPDIMKLCYDKDSYYIELRQLAIRIQKNGGVDIGDHRKSGQTYHRSFLTLELVRWLVDTFGLSRDLACLICKELWKHGLMWNAEDSYSPFMVSEHTFFRVAHPYAINLLLLPSEMEQVYSEARDKSGPKRIEKYLGGRLVQACFSATDLIDWVMSVHDINPSERAVQVVQQMANEGYFFNVDGSPQIVDGPHVFIQHKHDYVGNLFLSKRRMNLIAKEVSRFYEDCVQTEYGGKRPIPTVSLVSSLIECVIEDCSLVKAKHILLLMKRAKIVIVSGRGAGLNSTARGRVSGLGSATVIESVIRWSKGQENALQKELGSDDDPVMLKLDGQFVNLKTRGARRGTSGIVYPDEGRSTEDDIVREETYVPTVMKVTKSRSETVAQNLSVTLMSHLGGGSSIVKDGFFARENSRLKTMRILVHVLFCLALVAEVFLDTQSVLGLSDGIRASISRTAGFADIASASDFIQWTAAQLSSGLSWRGSQFPLLEPPAILFGGASHLWECSPGRELVTDVARKGVENTVEFDVAVPAAYAGEDISCWINEETLATGFENSYDGHPLVLLCMRTPDGCTGTLAALKTNLSVPASALLVDRMALEMVMLGFKADPPLILKVTAQTKFSGMANDVLVRALQVPDRLGFAPLDQILIMLITGVSLDLFLLSCARGWSFLFNISRLFHVARIVLPSVALHTHNAFEKRLHDYLSTVTWENAHDFHSHAGNYGFDSLHDQKTNARVLYILAMFLAVMSLPTYIGGAKYNIFALLQKTLKTVQGDVKVLAITFLISFCGFVATIYAIMNSLSSLFASPGSTGMIMYGSLFGGAPWSTFFENRGTSRLLSGLGFMAMATYLFLFIIILLNMFVAIIIQSYQAQKRDEAVLRAEFVRHLHASEGTTDISTLKERLGERLYEIAEVDEPHKNRAKVMLQRTIKTLTERLRSTAKVHHDDSFVSQSTSEIFPDDDSNAPEKSSVQRQPSGTHAGPVDKTVSRQDSKLVRKTPPALVKQGSRGGGAQGLPRKLQQML